MALVLFILSLNFTIGFLLNYFCSNFQYRLLVFCLYGQRGSNPQCFISMLGKFLGTSTSSFLCSNLICDPFGLFYNLQLFFLGKEFFFISMKRTFIKNGEKYKREGEQGVQETKNKQRTITTTNYTALIFLQIYKIKYKSGISWKRGKVRSKKMTNNKLYSIKTWHLQCQSYSQNS